MSANPIMSRPMLSRLRSPPLSAFFVALPTTELRRSFSPSSMSLPSMRRERSRGERCGERSAAARDQIFLDGELLVEGVVLRDVGDVAAQGVEFVVERTAVEHDAAAVGPVLPGDGLEQRALAAAARAHDADHLAARDGEVDVVQRRLGRAEGVPQVAHVEHADDVAFFFEDALGEVAAQHLAHVDADEVAVGQPRVVAHGRVADEDRAAGLEHLQLADLLFVVARDFQQHVAARAGGEQDVVGVEQAGVVRDEVLALVGEKLEPAAERAGAAAQVDERQFAVVVEDDLVFERGLDARAALEFDAVEPRVDAPQRRDLHLQPEAHLQHAVARAGALEGDLVVLVDGQIHLRDGDVFLGVEVRDEFLVGQHALADDHALPLVHAAQRAALPAGGR